MKTIKFPILCGTQTEANDSVKRCPLNLENIPHPFRHYEMCLEALQKDIRVFPAIPCRFHNETICTIAFKQDGLLLRYLEGNNRPDTFCQLAIDQNPKALAYTTRGFQKKWLAKKQGLTNRLIKLLGLEKYGNPTISLKFPSFSKTYSFPQATKRKLIDEDLQLTPSHIPNYTKYLKPEESMNAVQENAYSLRYVKPQLRDKDMCILAATTQPAVLKSVPTSLISQTFLEEIHKSNPEGFYNAVIDMLSHARRAEQRVEAQIEEVKSYTSKKKKFSGF